MPPRKRDILATIARASVARPQLTSRTRHRVWPRYVDINVHMNYGSYLEVFELARWDWGIRSGLFGAWTRHGARPVVGSLTIHYKRELRPLTAFEIDTRLVGFDRRAMIVQHTIWVGETLYSHADLNILLLKGGRPLDAETVRELCEVAVVERLAV